MVKKVEPLITGGGNTQLQSSVTQMCWCYGEMAAFTWGTGRFRGSILVHGVFEQGLEITLDYAGGSSYEGCRKVRQGRR